ncbi:hypothetical protein QL285_045585 [Trifolium repens]|nr:hypothetical protein QL285_045585 [Trifolium repens]
MGKPIQVGRVIAQSIKRMVTSSEASIGHPFVISHLCSLAGVPEEDDDNIIGADIPLGTRFLSRAQRDFERAQQGQQLGMAIKPILAGTRPYHPRFDGENPS